VIYVNTHLLYHKLQSPLMSLECTKVSATESVPERPLSALVERSREYQHQPDRQYPIVVVLLFDPRGT